MAKIVFPFILGITIGDTWLQSKHLFEILCVFSVLWLILVLIRYQLKKYSSASYSALSSYTLILICFCLGSLLTIFHSSKSFSEHISLHTHQIVVTSTPVPSKKSFKAEGRLLSSYANGVSINSPQKVLIYFIQTDTVHVQLHDTLYITKTLNPISPPLNPHQFDYRKFLSRSGIYFQFFLKEQDYAIKSKQSNKLFFTRLYQFRGHLQHLINTYIQGNKQQSFASAILLGNKSTLDNELKEIYSATGAMHVLAVSGLHVGIIYLFGNFVLSIFTFFLKKQHLKFILLILLVWIYALLTGASPSVLRAATMFSFILVGKLINRNVNIYNTLGASAFLLLVINPMLLFQVGFQLSYVAVIGIVYLQPKIYRLIYLHNYVLDKIWAITTVSIAAQIATFPIGIYYFNQFPNYFWLSNLIVIPAATIVVYLGIVLLLFGSVELLAKWIGKLLTFIIEQLHIIIDWISHLPFALTENLYINFFQLILLYAIMVGMLVWLQTRKKQFIWITLTTILIMVIMLTKPYIPITESNQLIVYNVPKQTYFEVKEGHQVFTFSQDTLEKETFLYNIQPNHITNRLAINTSFIHPNNNQFPMLMERKNICVLWLPTNSALPPYPVQVDYAIISYSLQLNLDSVATYIDAPTYIFDSSFPYWTISDFREKSEKLGLNSYYVSNNQAFVVDLN